MRQKVKVKVTQRALIQRINRVLAKDDKVLKAARSASSLQNLGNWYILDIRQNFVNAQHVNPEVLGRDLKVLRPWEVLDEGGSN